MKLLPGFHTTLLIRLGCFASLLYGLPKLPCACFLKCLKLSSIVGFNILMLIIPYSPMNLVPFFLVFLFM